MPHLYYFIMYFHFCISLTSISIFFLQFLVMKSKNGVNGNSTTNSKNGKKLNEAKKSNSSVAVVWGDSQESDSDSESDSWNGKNN